MMKMLTFFVDNTEIPGDALGETSVVSQGNCYMKQLLGVDL